MEFFFAKKRPFSVKRDTAIRVFIGVFDKISEQFPIDVKYCRFLGTVLLRAVK